jgi:hypothetical protein
MADIIAKAILKKKDRVITVRWRLSRLPDGGLTLVPLEEGEVPEMALPLPPPRQCAAALKQIEPKTEHRAQCDLEIIRALHCIRLARLNPAFSPARRLTRRNAERKRQLVDRIKKLHSIENAEHARIAAAKRRGTPIQCMPADWAQIYSSYYLRQTRRERERLEETASKIKIRPASKSRDPSRQLAAVLAHKLIVDFSNSRPSVTRYGPWHELANILAGAGNLFEEVREYHRLLEKDRAKADRINKALCDLLRYILDIENHHDQRFSALRDLFWALH